MNLGRKVGAFASFLMRAVCVPHSDGLSVMWGSGRSNLRRTCRRVTGYGREPEPSITVSMRGLATLPWVRLLEDGTVEYSPHARKEMAADNITEGERQGVSQSGKFPIVVSGFLSPSGPPGRIVDWLRAGSVIAVVDERILGEYAEDLVRPAFGLRLADVDDVLAAIRSQATWVEVGPDDMVKLPDPDDAAFAECALVERVTDWEPAPFPEASLSWPANHDPSGVRAVCWGRSMRDALRNEERPS